MNVLRFLTGKVSLLNVVTEKKIQNRGNKCYNYGLRYFVQRAAAMDLLIRLWHAGLPGASGPLQVLWVALQAGDHLPHGPSLEADLIHGREQREPAEKGPRRGCYHYQHSVTVSQRLSCRVPVAGGG